MDLNSTVNKTCLDESIDSIELYTSSYVKLYNFYGVPPPYKIEFIICTKKMAEPF